MSSTSGDEAPRDFIRTIVAEDVASGKYGGRVVTRFPPEPNGRLHIGHAKAITVDFGIAEEHGGVYHLRFDDTNPAAEEEEFVEEIMRDIRWLGFDWGERLFFASDYFARLHEFAVDLIKRGKAYVCDLSSDEIAAYRGAMDEPGRDSPYRERSIEENLDLFARMRTGEFPPGQHSLRAKIDMASNVLPMRDPVIYRVLDASHHRTGDRWHIYPMYDFAHCLSDSLEGITHSLCSIEYIDHKPLYDWFLDELEVEHHPAQIEFARLVISHTVLSKRRLRRLVEEGLVNGWDDPRMPTLAAMRRRGYRPQAIRALCDEVGTARRSDVVIQMARLEAAVRDDLNRAAPRAMAVLRPLRLVIENYPDDRVEEFELPNHPQDASRGTRRVPFAREIWIERDDFLEDPPAKFFRLAPGREVRLRGAYLITCTDVVRDATSGEISELRCRYDPDSRGGNAPDGRKVKGTLHWVSARHARRAEVRLYGPLFAVEKPDDVREGGDFTDNLNPESREILRDCAVEPGLAAAAEGSHVQFERLGYFCVDPDSAPDALVFNRTVTLRDSWAKIASKA